MEEQTVQDKKQIESQVDVNPLASFKKPFYKTPIALILIAIFVVVGAFFVGGKFLGAKEEKTAEITPSESAVSLDSKKVSPTIDPTLNWKMYTSVCGYTLKYPEDYVIKYASKVCGEGHHDDISILSPDNGVSFWLNISVDKNPKTTNFEDEIKAYAGISKEQQEPATIAGSPAVRFKVRKNEQAGISVGAIVLNDGKFFQFNTTGNENAVNIFDQILKTFKIISTQQSVDTSTWKTYTNSKYGFSLKYPATGQVQDPSCFGEASCPKHVGVCGLDIQELYTENPPTVTIDNFFGIVIKAFSGSIAQYLKQVGAEGKYDTQVVQVPGSDEAISIDGIKNGVTFEGYDPLNNTSYLIKKGKNLFSIVGFQDNAGEGCLPEVSAPLPADGVPSWDIPGSFSFTR